LNFYTLGLHILYQKTDGVQFQRNEYAHDLEVFCSTYFYGPLVIAFSDANAPYKLYDFPPHYLEEHIQPLNEKLQRIYPLPINAKLTKTQQQLMSERRYTLDLNKLQKELNIHQFMIYCYKTSFCPQIKEKHDWPQCNYAHRL
jgi:hypothetical protein